MSRKVMNGLNLLGQPIVNVADAVNPTDAVNLEVLQAYVRGLAWKAAVRAASTANVNISSPGGTLDGVALVSGDRVLLKNQTAAAENGIYVWTGAATALTRSSDANIGAQLEGATVTVTQGNQVLSATPAGSIVFTQTSDNVTLGTTALTWVVVGGGAAAYTAGNGLSLSGGAFSVTPGVGIIADGTNTRIDTNVVARRIAGNCTASATQTFTHNFGTRDVTVTVYDAVSYEEVLPDVVHTDANTVSLTFATAPAAGAYRIVVVG